MVTFIHRFVRFYHKREYSTRLTKQKFNRGTIEAFSKKKEKFLDLISLLPIHTFWGIRMVPRKRDCCGQINIPCHQHLESKTLLTSHPNLNQNINNWNTWHPEKMLKSNLVHTTRLFTLYRFIPLDHLILTFNCSTNIITRSMCSTSYVYPWCVCVFLNIQKIYTL